MAALEASLRLNGLKKEWFEERRERASSWPGWI